MTTAQLHEILDDEDRKLSKKELLKIVGELYVDVREESYKYNIQDNKYHFYCGEQNAFRIVLDLLEHLEEKEYEFE